MNTIAIILYSNFFYWFDWFDNWQVSILRKFINFYPPPICLNVYKCLNNYQFLHLSIPNKCQTVSYLVSLIRLSIKPFLLEH